TVRPGETCAGANVASGDGCSSACSFEGSLGVEREENDLAIESTNLSRAVRGISTTLIGGIEPIGDVDTFAVDVTGGPAALTAQTHGLPGASSSCLEIDTMLELLDSNGRSIVIDDDGDGSLVPCSTLSPALHPEVRALQPGRYYVRVHAFKDSKHLPA